MAEARLRERWNHTAALLAMLANAHRDPKKTRAFAPADFHPLPQKNKREEKPLKAELSILKTVFVENRW